MMFVETAKVRQRASIVLTYTGGLERGVLTQIRQKCVEQLDARYDMGMHRTRITSFFSYRLF